MNNQTRRYSDSEKLQIIEEYMNSGESMETFQAKPMGWAIAHYRGG